MNAATSSLLNRDRFLIAMPTRHREGLVQRSLTGLLDLQRDDVRLLVSDNSDQPSEPLQAFCRANGIDYVRPDRVMRMTEHWSWILETQDYRGITMTTDRSTLWLDVYRQSKEIAERTNRAVRTGDATYIEKRRLGMSFGVLSTQVRSGHIYEVPTAVIRKGVKEELVHTALPLPQNSILMRSEVDAVFAKFGPLSGIAPDYEFGYKYIHTFENGIVTLLDKTMTISHSKQLSNGGGLDGKVKNGAADDFLRLNGISSLDFSPLPSEINSFSVVAHDLNKILTELGKSALIRKEVVQKMRRKTSGNEPSFLARRIRFARTLLGIDPNHLLKIRFGYDPLDAQRIKLPLNAKLSSYRPFFIFA